MQTTLITRKQLEAADNGETVTYNLDRRNAHRAEMAITDRLLDEGFIAGFWKVDCTAIAGGVKVEISK